MDFLGTVDIQTWEASATGEGDKAHHVLKTIGNMMKNPSKKLPEKKEDPEGKRGTGRLRTTDFCFS